MFPVERLKTPEEFKKLHDAIAIVRERFREFSQLFDESAAYYELRDNILAFTLVHPDDLYTALKGDEDLLK